MNGTQNLNIDSKTLEQCLKEISNFGATTYQNICTGESTVVVWGGADWFGGVVITIFLLAFIVWFLKEMFTSY